ncbi:hypothetical protein KCV01_g9593, partial [Aureobasidium melanogenum]
MIHDVVIAGAGPVGLFLACELRLAGCSVLVLERDACPDSPWKKAPFGMRGLSVPTVEAFQRRGLLDEIVAEQRAASGDATPRHPGSHFAGIAIDDAKVDASAWTYRLPGQGNQGMAVEMAVVERVLTHRAMSLGVDLRRGMPVESITTRADGIVARSSRLSFHARWLVGCDGGRSIVRKLAGFEFAGTEPAFTGYSIQARFADPDTLRLGRMYTETGMYVQSRPGTVAMVEFDGGAMHRGGPLTEDHVQAVLRRVSGTDVTLDTLDAATTWTDRARQTTTYRRGRVLLAGDAAHIHSPLGGQGLNLGLGDAMNLGWKLAATVRGDAPEGLLDTYTSERHAAGAQVLDMSRAQVELMRPNPGTHALRNLLRDLIDTRDGATYLAERVRGVAVRYDLGDEHPLVGRSAPELRLSQGSSLSEVLMTGKGVMIDFAGEPGLEQRIRRFVVQLTYAEAEPGHPFDIAAMLVRPDGIVAGVAATMPERAFLEKVVSRWFGNSGLEGK